MSESHSPLAQFEIHSLVPITWNAYDLSFTNSSMMMMLAVAATVLFMFMGVRRLALVPGRWQSASEIMVDFVADITKSAAGKEAMKYFPFIFTVFTFILFCNLLGMVPTMFTVTSHIVVTFAMAFGVFLACTLLAIFKHGPIKFLKFFVPSGLPIIMAPLMFPIEFLSYFARPISLSLRLAINMMVGHMLLKIVAGFVFMMGLWGFLPIAFLVALTAFEVGIALLQAYIFTLLACVYLNDALHLH